MKKLTFLPKCFFLLLTLSVACSDDDSAETEPGSYAWTPSSISPDGPFAASRIQSNNDTLYALAYFNETKGIFRYNGNEWDLYKEIPFGFLGSYDQFTIINDVVYYSRYNELYKFQGSTMEKILSRGYIKNLYEFQGKLIIAGDAIEVSNSSYSVITYDGTTFTGLSDESVSGKIFEVNGKLFFPGLSGQTYDGTTITPIAFSGNFYGVDQEESLYFNDMTSNGTRIFKQLKNGNKIKVGEDIPEHPFFNSLEFIDNTIVGVANSNPQSFSFTYFLRDNAWIEVPAVATLANLTIHKNTLFATTQGSIVELVKSR
jgi:hypothetical protein